MPPAPTAVGAGIPPSAPDTDLDLLSQGVAAPNAKSLEGLKAISVW